MGGSVLVVVVLLPLAPAKMFDKSCIALMCFNLSALVVGITAPSVLISCAAVAMDISCCEVIGT